MGKIRIKTLGLEDLEKKQSEDAQKRRESKKQKQQDSTEKIRPIGGKGGERMKQVEISDEALAKQKEAEKAVAKASKTDEKTAKKEKREEKVVKKPKIKGKNYLSSKRRIDKLKKYSLAEAIKLLRKVTFASFDESIELHINTHETGLKGEVDLPHSIGKETKVVVLDDKILVDIEKGVINFDVLITHPSYMPKLAKFAKVLGPKGLMPNPKSGTISDKPEEAKNKFKKGTLRWKSEVKAPIIHQVIGKLSFKDNALYENITAFIQSVKKPNIKSAYISSTMSPSIQIDIKE